MNAIRPLAAALLLLPFVAGEASAACTRRIVNRSALTLVASQDGGPAFVVPPGHARTVRLAAPGRFDLAATCPAAGFLPGETVAQGSFAYEAILDRCYIRFGTDALNAEFGRGTLGLQSTAPFTVNNPRQGDIVLGPVAEACLPQ
ncbi:hypothetical protein [Methylobacterium oryzihabitans]|uniref:Uncharacterized protein n=1 Tax=Methylobacterium oryzihabitans TaxID=2499852 RepID=A0A437NZQ6_9HYPH|nr:hypothetical protein [Methylobacterium oryzihabitans]RVU15493.1 hypothetical protein EOE48_19705 [Methylobacterium oryzihabitans]